METKDIILTGLSWGSLIFAGVGYGMAVASGSTDPPEEIKKQGINMLIVASGIFIASEILK